MNHNFRRKTAYTLGIISLAIIVGILSSPAHADQYRIVYKDTVIALPTATGKAAEVEVTAKSSQVFHRTLKNSGLFAIKDDTATAKAMKTLGMKECADVECSRSLGQSLKVAKVGNLIIEKEVRVYVQELTRYVSQRKVFVTYTVSARSVDAESGGIDCEFSEKATNGDEVQKKTLIISEKIVDYYRNHRPFDRIVIETPFFVPDRISAYPLYISPRGDYSRLFDYGLGIGARFSGYMPDYDGVRLNFDINVVQMFGTRDTIDSMQSASISAAAGYSLKFWRVETIPYLGLGYILNSIDGDKDGRDDDGNFNKSREFYYNPMLTAGFEFFFSVNREYLVFLNPAYGVMLEPDGTSPYLQVNMGAARKW